jgi:NADPH:quinone reductase-like Zn-dependent oxidoreductase
MKAIVHRSYGSPDVMRLEDIERPEPAEDEVLVRVKAASLNALDWYGISGRPKITRVMSGLRTPKDPRLGRDTAGVVEAVGSKITHLHPGDEVYGTGDGSLCEWIAGKHFAPKPKSISFEEAAAVPIAGMTALQGVRDVAPFEPGKKALVNGAGGGVGTFYVQVAKAFGAHVTATTSSEKVDLVRSLGADEVLDHDRQDFRDGGVTYDRIFEVGGKLTWPNARGAISSGGKLVMVGAGSRGFMGGPLGRPAVSGLRAAVLRQAVTFYISKESAEDLVALTELIEAGKVRPVIDSTYPLEEAADAMRRFESGPTGKIVITLPALTA